VEGCHEAARPARCGFLWAFERLLREEAADFTRQEVRKANDPSPDEEPPDATPDDVCRAPLSAVIRRLLRHADEDFRCTAFDGMTGRARKDAGRYWESARRYWARTVGRDISEIRLPENMRELEDGFWQRVDAVIGEVLGGRVPRSINKKKRRRTG
jgi:hypothetical protein